MKAENLEPEALLAALKAGQFYASQGPRLLDVEVRRDEVTVACSPVDAIALVTGTSRAISRIGRQMTGGTLEVGAATRQAWTDPGAIPWFRVVVIDAAGRRAWTNPIWVDQLED